MNHKKNYAVRVLYPDPAGSGCSGRIRFLKHGWILIGSKHQDLIYLELNFRAVLAKMIIQYINKTNINYILYIYTFKSKKSKVKGEFY